MWRSSTRLAVGLPISVFASVKLERQREEELDRFAAAVSRWPEVLECYLMTGHRDYMLRIVVPDLAAYEQFLKQKLTRLEGVGSIEFELRARSDQVLSHAADSLSIARPRSPCSGAWHLPKLGTETWPPRPSEGGGRSGLI